MHVSTINKLCRCGLSFPIKKFVLGVDFFHSSSFDFVGLFEWTFTEEANWVSHLGFCLTPRIRTNIPTNQAWFMLTLWLPGIKTSTWFDTKEPSRLEFSLPLEEYG